MISGEDREQGERENLGEFYIHHEDDMDLFFCQIEEEYLCERTLYSS